MLSFDNFQTLNPDAAQVAQDLLALPTQSSGFMPFITSWMAFNAWMECVTSARSDRQMIDAIADNRKTNDAFDRLLLESSFRDQVMQFAQDWPVLNVRDVRRKVGHDAFSRLSRTELLAECEILNVLIQPDGWIAGETPTWAQTLRTIYLIRCNLFHGSKSPQIFRDRQLVSNAAEVLRSYIYGSQCFTWRNEDQ